MVYLPRSIRTPSPVTFTLVIANVIVYIVTTLGGTYATLVLAQTGALFFEGFYWQVFTAMFVHFDIAHILFNMFALVYFGSLGEATYSRNQFLAIYLGSGIVGNVASLALVPLDSPTGGASGAIFGLIGAYVATQRKGVGLAFAGVYAVLIFLDSAGPGVNLFAHLFGVAAGLLLGFTFIRRAEESLR